MKPLFLLSLICAVFTVMQGCAPNGSPIAAHGRPQFLPQSSPDSLIETGIRQDPGTGGLFLEWYSVDGATGYKVYRSDTTDLQGKPFGFTLVRTLASSTSLSDTSMVDDEAHTGIRYYYYLVAYALDGSLSNASDTINYKLIYRPFLAYPPPNATLDKKKLYFSWHDYTGGGYTAIRVRKISSVPSVLIWVTKKFQIFDSYPTRTFDFDSTATAQLDSGQSYQWRVVRFDIDGTGRPYEGSTSTWSTFTLN